MPHFKDFAYSRPDIDALRRDFKALTSEFRGAASAAAQDAILSRVHELRNGFETLKVIAQIRHTMNTDDAFYDAENDFMDEAEPIYEGLKSEFFAALVGSPFKRELEARRGAQLFRLAELQMKTYSPEVEERLQAENRLASEYVKLKASASIDFQGQARNLAQMQPFTESADRAVRRDAVRAVSAFFASRAADFDRVFDELVRVRHDIALALGFTNFIPLAYARLGRSDYDAAMVANYRRQVRETVVPLAARLRERQARRLGLSSLAFHDEGLAYLSGNATPKGDADWILARGKAMYKEMSPETDDFFTMMTERGLLDLTTRKGKAGGGYCDYMADEQAPFIFSNFNGTSGDVDVLTHEAGHAFQCYRARGFEVPEYHWPTYEACEIHSMSMEFLAWPWMGSFFGPDEQKYKFTHLSEGVLFIPYGATVDEFQHWVYEHPEASPTERKAAWRAIEKTYLPYRDYADDAFLESGGYWYRQGHIFEDPFYYIDYTLAQVCAYEFWARSRADRPRAWADYLGLCDLGGSLPFTALVKAARLSLPFDDGAIARVMAPVQAWLDEADDSRL